jgi:hypothetical protein
MTTPISSAPKTKSSVTVVLYLILVVLVINLAIGFLNLIKVSPGAPDHSAEIANLTTLQTSLVSNYNTQVYHTSSVDNIYKQILMANENEFTMLNLIAQQNTVIMELLSGK